MIGRIPTSAWKGFLSVRVRGGRRQNRINTETDGLVTRKGSQSIRCLGGKIVLS